MLARAEPRRQRLGLDHVTLRCLDAEHMDFPDDSFDKVVAMYVVSVAPDPVRLVNEMRREFSEETAREIDCAVREIVTGAFEKATGILDQRRDWLERGAKLLLERETLVEEDLMAFRAPLSAVA